MTGRCVMVRGGDMYLYLKNLTKKKPGHPERVESDPKAESSLLRPDDGANTNSQAQTQDPEGDIPDNKPV